MFFGKGNNKKLDKRVKLAVLLFKMVRSDGSSKMLELLHMSEILRREFSLDQKQLEELFEEADAVDQTTTDVILESIGSDWKNSEKKKVVEYMWVLAFADNQICEKERHTIQHIAEALGLSLAERARCQERAESHLNL